MVCVPCFIIPVVLWIFYKFINPWLSKLWGNSENYVLSNLTCPLPEKNKRGKKEQNSAQDDTKEQNGVANGHTDLGDRLKSE